MEKICTKIPEVILVAVNNYFSSVSITINDMHLMLFVALEAK